jgi:uncharacterized protein YycO
VELLVGFRRGMFYDALNTLVSVFTLSKYSHVELFFGGKSYSATIGSGVRRLDYERFRVEEYTAVKLNITEQQHNRLLEFYEATKGMKYDWIGVFLKAWLPLGFHHKEKYFCFEWVSDALIYAGIIPNQIYSSKELYRVL